MFNGTHFKTCLIRETDDTFIHFDVDEIVCINSNDIEKFVELYENRKNDWNIIIDSRMEFIILMSFIKYGLDLLIYDSHKLLTYSIVEYFSSIMYVESTEMSLEELKIFCIGKIIITYVVPHLKIRWNKDVELEVIHQKRSLNMKYNVMFMLMHIMNVKNFIKVSTEKMQVFEDAYDCIVSTKAIKPLTKINENEFYSILCLMIGNY